MVVISDDVITVGDVRCDKCKRIEVAKADSVRVVFQLGEDWLSTDMLPMQDTIKICDATSTFEVEIVAE